MTPGQATNATDPGQGPLTAGTQIGAYRIEAPIGEGGMGVYSVQEATVRYIRKIPVGGGQPVTVRNDDALGCAERPMIRPSTI